MSPASFEAMQHATGTGSLGIRLREPPILDLPKTVAWR